MRGARNWFVVLAFDSFRWLNWATECNKAVQRLFISGQQLNIDRFLKELKKNTRETDNWSPDWFNLKELKKEKHMTD